MSDVAPGTGDCDACWEGNFSFGTIPVDLLVEEAELEDGLQEDEGEVSAGAVAGEYYVVWGDGGVERTRWWVEEGEVGDQSVEESCREWILRSQSIADAEAAAFGESG